MKPAPFTYHAPSNVEDLIQLLGSLEDVKLLAGGQSLMPMMNFRYITPEHVIDLNRIEALSGINIDDDLVTVGAMTRQHMLLEHAVLGARCPLIKAALTHVGHLATRNRGTIGGSLAHLDPAAELPAVLATLDANLTVNGPDGKRTVAMSDWSIDYMMPDLAENEWLEAVGFRLPAEPHGYGFHEMARRHGDFAVAGCAAQLKFDSDGSVNTARVTVLGVGVAPVRLLEAEHLLQGQQPTRELVEQAAACIANITIEIEDIHASPDYRRKVAGVMVRRALGDAASLDVILTNNRA